ncbi:MAG TPA: ParB/RepB/Spo0J family partition protein [Candidatus Omnitrophota bacterium]|nr:ParB/RepB/Spo0J family partition protein [Candidatus Omnitrophota bacterium]
MENRALGKGLSALIPDKDRSGAIAGEVVAYLKTTKIKNSRFQPRTKYDNEKLEELKESIKTKGIIQPILVRETQGGEYEVVAGERRLKAARALNMEDVPAIIKSVTDEEAFVIALIENVQREDLNPIEEAQAYQRLIEDFKLTQEDVAKAVGKDRSTVSNIMRLLKLPEEIQKFVYGGEISMGHARALLSLESAEDIKRFFGLIRKKGLSVRELENLIQSNDGKARRVKSKEKRDFEIVALEEQLQKALGTKVRIKANKKRGKIIIEYYSLDDLDRIIRKIK